PPLYPALAPFRSLSPALDLIFELLSGATEASRGTEAGWQRLHKVLQRLHRPVGGMPESFRGPARVTAVLGWTTDAGEVYQPVRRDERDDAGGAPSAVAILRPRLRSLRTPRRGFTRALVR